MAVHRRKRRQSGVGLAAAVTGTRFALSDVASSGGECVITLEIETAILKITESDATEVGRAKLYDPVADAWSSCTSVEFLSTGGFGQLVELKFTGELAVDPECTVFVPADWKCLGGELGAPLRGFKDGAAAAEWGAAAAVEGYLIVRSTSDPVELLYETVTSIESNGTTTVVVFTSTDYAGAWTTVDFANWNAFGVGAAVAVAALGAGSFELEFTGMINDGSLVYMNGLPSPALRASGVTLLPGAWVTV